MSKSAKTKRALERRKIKAGRKAAEQAKYESYKASGSNKKSKRSKIKAGKVNSVRVNRHATSCDNFGCEICFVKVDRPTFPKATKPWKTSAEKLAFRNRKLLQEREEQKRNRQLLNEKEAA